jgi:drug/metabolite transporter (DMT)-like permease
MNSTALRTGVALSAITALISGVSVYVNSVFIKEFPDPILLAAVRNSAVGLVLLLVLAVATIGGRPAGFPKEGRGRIGLGLGILGLIGGGVPFALFFTGLAIAASPAAVLIQKTMFVWVALLAVPLLGESLGGIQLGALAALAVGTVLLGTPTVNGIGLGEVLIVIATVLWAVEVIVARRLLAGGTSSLGTATARMTIGGLFLLGLVAVLGHLPAIAALTLRQWALIALTGALLAGYVSTWYGALQRAPATTVTSVLAGGAIVTSLLQAVARGTAPRPIEAAGLVLLLAGAGLTVLALRAAARRAAILRPSRAGAEVSS